MGGLTRRRTTGLVADRNAGAGVIGAVVALTVGRLAAGLADGTAKTHASTIDIGLGAVLAAIAAVLAEPILAATVFLADAAIPPGDAGAALAFLTGTVLTRGEI